MASFEKFLDDYEIRRLDFDSDDSEDDRHSDDEVVISVMSNCCSFVSGHVF